jgi:hypothetical protein
VRGVPASISTDSSGVWLAVGTCSFLKGLHIGGGCASGRGNCLVIYIREKRPSVNPLTAKVYQNCGRVVVGWEVEDWIASVDWAKSQGSIQYTYQVRYLLLG